MRRCRRNHSPAFEPRGRLLGAELRECDSSCTIYVRSNLTPAPFACAASPRDHPYKRHAVRAVSSAREWPGWGLSLLGAAAPLM